MKQFLSRQNKPLLILALLIAVMLLALFIPLISSQNVLIQQNRICSTAFSVEDILFEEVETPNTPIGVKEIYTFTLDDKLADDAHLGFYTVHQYAEVYIDNAIVYRQVPQAGQSVIKTVGCNWVMLPLRGDDAGKDVRIEITPVYESFRGQKVDFLLGAAMDIYTDCLHHDLFSIVLCAAIFFIGIVFIVFAACSMYFYKTGKSLLMLGLSATMFGLWRLLDLHFSPFLFTNRPVFWYYLSLILLMFCLLPLYKSISNRFSFIHKKTVNVYLICSISVSTLLILLQIFGIYDLRETLFVTHLSIITGAAIVFISVALHFNEFLKGFKKSMEGAFLLLLFIGAMADLLLFYLINDSSGLAFTMTAFLLYFSFSGIRLVTNFVRQEHALREDAVRLADKERQLTQSRMVSMTGQIRAHFIFNILNAISGLCKYDPEKADETVVRFARFLRTNINILEDDKPVPFTAALNHLSDYISLEQVRFGDRVRFETDIQCDDFLIPPLILQPIVENSVKHGLTSTTSGGRILLQSWEEENTIYIRIQDNGTGFDTSADPNDDSTGLKNVRYRLKHVSNGDMHIDSSPGKGTTVTLTIPRTEVS